MDFGARQAALHQLLEQSADLPQLVRQLLEHREDGRIKLYISQRLLCLRRERPELFVGGSYLPLRGNQHVAAFTRSAHAQTLLIAAPIQIATLTRGALTLPIGHEVWRDHSLSIPGDSSRNYRDVFTGRTLTGANGLARATLKLADVFADFPVAALLSD